MQVPSGTNLIEPILVWCMSIIIDGKKEVWAGLVKLHLLYPKIKGVALLKVLRSFILHLQPHSSVETLGKVCRAYHSFASSNNLSIIITSYTSITMSSHALFLDLLESSLWRNHDFMIVEAQKGTLTIMLALLLPHLRGWDQEKIEEANDGHPKYLKFSTYWYATNYSVVKSNR